MLFSLSHFCACLLCALPHLVTTRKHGTVVYFWTSHEAVKEIWVSSLCGSHRTLWGDDFLRFLHLFWTTLTPVRTEPTYVTKGRKFSLLSLVFLFSPFQIVGAERSGIMKWMRGEQCRYCAPGWEMTLRQRHLDNVWNTSCQAAVLQKRTALLPKVTQHGKVLQLHSNHKEWGWTPLWTHAAKQTCLPDLVTSGLFSVGPPENAGWLFFEPDDIL